MIGRVRIGICEDEPRLRSVLTHALTADGFDVRVAATSAEAPQVFTRDVPDVVILDLGVQDLDGRALCRELRDHGVDAPVLFLAQRERLREQLAGLDTSDDDFVISPFSLPEIIVRVVSLARRHDPEPAHSRGVRLSANRHCVYVGDRAVPLTPTEFRMLETLVARRGSVVHRSELISVTWPESRMVTANSLDAYIARLRRKLRPLQTGEHIETVRGVGYSLR